MHHRGGTLHPAAALLGGPALARDAEDRVDNQGEQQIKPVDDAHHDDHEGKHDQGELDQLLASRRDHLAQFSEDLPDEQGDPREDVRLLRAPRLARRDDVVAWLTVDV